MFSEWMTSQTFACAHHKFLFAVHKTNKTKNILYHVCFDNRDSLPGGDDDDDDDDDNNNDDTGDISTCDVEATCDEVAEICRKQVIWYNAIMSHVFSEISLYIHSFLDVAMGNFSKSVFVC